jgi:hypothetical protein
MVMATSRSIMRAAVRLGKVKRAKKNVYQKAFFTKKATPSRVNKQLEHEQWLTEQANVRKQKGDSYEEE